MPRFGRIDRRNDDEGLRHEPVIGDPEVDPRLITLWRQRLEPGQRPTRLRAPNALIVTGAGEQDRLPIGETAYLRCDGSGSALAPRGCPIAEDGVVVDQVAAKESME